MTVYLDTNCVIDLIELNPVSGPGVVLRLAIGSRGVKAWEQENRKYKIEHAK